MAKETYAYVRVTGNTYLKLGNDGLELEITEMDQGKKGGETKVGTLYVGRGGVNWKPAHGKKKGDRISWSNLENFHD